jgi:CRP/FNR family cyclic AMP-dependent transcriptional regulator
MNTTELLGRVTLFRSLKKKQLETLALFCTIQTYQPGQEIVKEGDTGLGLYVIISGHAEVYKEQNGGRSATLTQYGPGDFFGEMSLLDDFPRSATVVAVDWVECLTLAKWHFLAELERHPEMALPLLPILSRRIRAAEERLRA